MSMSRDGGRKRKLYRRWESMVGRCRDKGHTSFAKYGGSGIRVAQEWVGPGGYQRFIDYIGEPPTVKHTIERLDSSGNYEPGNVRWATYLEQGRNKSNSVLATISGDTRTINEWCDVLGTISSSAAYDRVTRGWSPEAALLTPKYQRRPLTGDDLQEAIDALG
jgi:hypothetical protein